MADADAAAVPAPEAAGLFEAIGRRPWNSRRYALPDWHRRYPTMLTREEMRMLAWLGEHVAAPGAIVDLGCFLGGSTVSLAWGAARGPSPRRIWSYDRFAIDEKHKFRYLYQRGHGFHPGTDARPLFDRFTRAFAATITAVPGDVLAQDWQEGPIALLFVDLSKTLAINDHILETFFGALVPGSLVVQQDFLFFRNPWLYPTMHRLEDAIELLGHTEENAVIFGARRTPSPEEIRRCLSREVTPEATLAAIAHFRSRFPEVRQAEMIDALEAAFRARPGGDKAWDFANVAALPASEED
jgi:hypothetical protein